ncbi:hypothetical protein AYR66_09900 [Noviherbaspirillum denitrificans]|uniref:Uncharacterized protein n=2 Tax=Noviherbaspirillum denitrificans TaxID=1968433 RepID=A0A254TAT8_9BURK|nr:hypothetical protein AYR66_09900 [Noviherbaspirillum denitrificans]
MPRCKLYNGIWKNCCCPWRNRCGTFESTRIADYPEQALPRTSVSGMELAPVPLPPFASRSVSGNQDRCEDFISTIYSTTPVAMAATGFSPADNEVAGKVSRNGREEIHDGKD